jgi:uncharacterized protein (TIGR04222 family)
MRETEGVPTVVEVGMGDTWGISGPDFLAIYAVLLALATVVAVFDRRRRLRAGAGGRPMPGEVLDTYEAAYLNGGPQLVAAAALASLRQALAIRVSDGRPVTTAELPAGAHPVERDVYRAVEKLPRAGGRPSLRLLADGAPRIAELRVELERRGLALSEEQRSRARRAWLWYLPVLGLGVARAVAGSINGKPIAFLVMLLILTGLLAMGVGAKPRMVTRAGRRLFGTVRRGGPQSVFHAGGPVTAGLAGAVALGGTGVLWTEDNELASTLGLRRTGGPGSSASASGCGSSCGGGGGCGGGGCGGGGCGG